MTDTQIKKLEHSSFLLLHKGKRILFDPGVFSQLNEELHNVDVLIITHKHGDHLIPDHVKYVVENGNNTQIITNTEVAEQLKDNNFDIKIVEGTDAVSVGDITITAHDNKHEEIFGEFNLVQNTGYYVDDVFFHPGDSFTSPSQATKAVATPIIAPFMSIKSAINYINQNPEIIHFGAHDSVAIPNVRGWLKNIIAANIIESARYEHPETENEFVSL